MSLASSAASSAASSGTACCSSRMRDRKSTRLNSSHSLISYAVFCLKKKNNSRCVYTSVHEGRSCRVPPTHSNILTPPKPVVSIFPREIPLHLYTLAHTFQLPPPGAL